MLVVRVTETKISNYQYSRSGDQLEYFKNGIKVATISDFSAFSLGIWHVFNGGPDPASFQDFTVYNIGDDKLFGNLNDDKMVGGLGSDELHGLSGKDTLLGGPGTDLLDGGDGSDVLNGGDGYDYAYFVGLIGDYTFKHDEAGNIVVTSKLFAGDVDVVSQTEAFYFGESPNAVSVNSLPYEKPQGPKPEPPKPDPPRPVVFVGDYGPQILIGNELNNVMKGLAGNDSLFGEGGRDKLHGGLGRDSLWGGEGGDYFIFDTAPSKANADTIRDFEKADTIQVNNAVFKGVKNGWLRKANFWEGYKAHDKDDRFIYDEDRGHLWYDADGTGRIKQVLVIKVQDAPSLDHRDIFAL